MALKTAILVQEEESFLQGKLSSSKKLSEEKRIKCLLYLKREKHVYRQDLAKDLMISPRTLERWINKYNAGGFEELLCFERMTKVSSQITPEIHQALKEKVSNYEDCFSSYKEALD